MSTDKIAERLRHQAATLRTKSLPLSDLIPLLCEAADALDAQAPAEAHADLARDLEMAAALMVEASKLIDSLDPCTRDGLALFRWPLIDELDGAAGILRDRLAQSKAQPKGTAALKEQLRSDPAFALKTLQSAGIATAAGELTERFRSDASPAPAPEVPAGPRTEFVLNELRSALSAMTTFFGMDEDEASKPTFDKARQALNYAEIVMRPLEPWERQSLEDFRACVHRWHEKAVAKGYDGVEAMCDTALPYGTPDLRLVSASPAVAHQGGVDCIGLALDLEARAKTVESQTTERAMKAAAHGLRLLASSQTHAVAHEPLSDEQWLKRWTRATGERLKPGLQRMSLLSTLRFAERAYGITGKAKPPVQGSGS